MEVEHPIFCQTGSEFESAIQPNLHIKTSKTA